MKLCINHETTTVNLQEAFSYCYPYLGIEFYTHELLRNNQRRKKLIIGKLLPWMITTPAYSFIDINKEQTVAEVENAFAGIGLAAQILRKSGTVWIETILTRYLSLEVQNHEAEILCRSIAEMPQTRPRQKPGTAV